MSHRPIVSIDCQHFICLLLPAQESCSLSAPHHVYCGRVADPIYPPGALMRGEYLTVSVDRGGPLRKCRSPGYTWIVRR